ncbi:MAG: gliding motility-associated C-terminal domain-containing protein [Bacteroidetes bacterium]|nr:gliding motility-associated C-terminal domain-containing protein [Bacteroidota bacterium]
MNNGPFGPNNIFTGLGPGSYLITVQDANGCKKDTTVVIEPIVQLWMATDTIINPICPDSNGKVVVHINGGTGPYIISWSNGDFGNTCDSIGPGGVVATVTDANGCVEIFPIILVYDSLPEVQYTLTQPVCGDSSGAISITVTNGTPAYTLLWNTGDTSYALNNLMAGFYGVTVTDAKGCVTNFSTNLTDLDPVTTSISSTNTKCGLNNGVANVLATAGVPPYTYQWIPSGQLTATATNLPPGVHICKTMDATNCFTLDTFNILPSLALINSVSYSNANCDTSNGSIYLNGVQNAQGTVTRLWSNGQTGTSISGLAAGTYWIQTTDAIGCVKTDTSTVVTFTQPPLIELSYVADSVVCFNDYTSTISYSASGGTPGYLYSFNNGIYNSDTAQYQNTQGSYTVLVKDANNCTRPFNVEVPGPKQALDVKFDKKNIYCFELQTGSFTATILGGWQPYTYTWSNGANGLTFNNLGETNMTIYVTDNMGCDIEKDVNIEILQCCKMVVPNAFTPNADGLNDFLKPIAISEVTDIKFSIYDRWGKMVFNTKTLGDRWDGSVHEIPCNMGVYYYYLEYNCPFELNKFILKGDITLIR